MQKMARVLEVLQKYLLFSTDVKLAVENFHIAHRIQQLIIKTYSEHT